VSKQLLPCPFCGAPARIVHRASEMVAVYVHVECSVCGARKPEQYGVGWISEEPKLRRTPSPEEAVVIVSAAWNRRPELHRIKLAAYRAGVEAAAKRFDGAVWAYDYRQIAESLRALPDPTPETLEKIK
jgi:Lar family restriction alleviation protein